jgi:ABC-type nitrate/sulfonate/bicarbonate transport system substrate-binding protein
MRNSHGVSRRHLLGGAAAWTGTMICRRVGAASTAPASRVDIVMTEGETGLTLQKIGQAQGFFDEFNVVPDVLLVSDSAKCVAALLSGTSKICMWSGFNQVTPAIQRGAKLKILAGALSLPSLALYSGRPEIQKAADLQGKVIGVGTPGAVLHQMTVLLLRKKGVDPDKVNFRNVGSNADIFKAVVARTVDAGLSDVDVMDEQARYGVHVLADGMLWREIPEYTNQASYASDDAIAHDRDALVHLLAAYAKTYRFVSGPQSKEAFIKAWQAVTGRSESEEAVTQWNWIQKYHPYATGLVLSADKIDLIQKLNVEFKVQKQVLPINDVADMSLAEDALKLLS